jgi:hypothetical protein
MIRCRLCSPTSEKQRQLARASATDYRFVASLAMMDDVLPLINIVSKTMQATDADFTNLVNLVPPTLEVLKNLETAPGPAYSELEERLRPHGDLCDVAICATTTLRT